MNKRVSILAFFWPHIKPYWGYYLAMMATPMLDAFYPLIYNYAIKLFLDGMTGPRPFSFSLVAFPITLFFCNDFFMNLLWRLSQIAEWKSEPYVRWSLLTQSYNTVQHQSFQFFQDHFTGALSSKLKGIIDGYDIFWGEMHHGLFQNLYKFILGFVILSLFNIKLGLCLVIWIIFYIPIVMGFTRKLNQLSFEVSESKHRLIGIISDRLTNIHSLFSFASRKREYVSLRETMMKEFVPKQIRTYKKECLMALVLGVFYISVLMAFIFIMIDLRIKEMVSIGDFAFVFGMVLSVIESTWQVAYAFKDFSRAMGELRSAISVVLLPSNGLDSPEAVPLILKHPTIEFRHLQFGYEKKEKIFNDLSLMIHAGEKIGLVGSSGAGKSTLVNLLLRYFPLDSGEILVDQQNILTLTQDSLREHIAVIPQEAQLFHRTLLENIRYGRPSATLEEVIEASKKASIHEFIMTLPQQYHCEVGERGTKLSGGQRQRIAIARAILKDAPILILDEATSSLDSHTEDLIQKSLEFFFKDKTKTVLAIAHRLSTLRTMDRIIILDQGKIIEEGTHNALIHRMDSFYKKLWDLQNI